MLSQYLGLILYKTYADLRAETERTYLGFLWWVFEPIMFMGVFYLFFGVLMARGTDDFVSFLLVGLTAWQWFKSGLAHGGEAILQGHGLIQHVKLPKIIFPIILMLTDGVKFMFILALLLLFLWLKGYGVGTAYLALPIVVFVQFMLIVGISLVLAAVIPFFPDLRIVIDNVLQAVFFMSGIFMDASIVPERFHTLYYLNPMVNLIDSYRQILMHNTLPDWSALAWISLFSIICMIIGQRLISKYEYIYPKIMV